MFHSTSGCFFVQKMDTQKIQKNYDSRTTRPYLKVSPKNYPFLLLAY